MNKISLIIPVYNEESHLKEFLEKVDTLELPLKKELVLINDCSKDRSKDIIENFPFKSETIFIDQSKNQGKGAALRAGIQKATGDIIGIQDADFEYDMTEVPSLIQPFLESKADVVYGSRFRKDGSQVHRTFHYMINRFLTLLSNFSSGLYLSDMETCYKFFRADVIKNIKLESDRFGFEPEITAKVARLKVRVMELPISYYPRNYLEGKKITWKDGVAALRHILYFNFVSPKQSFFEKSMEPKYLPSGRQWL